MKYSVWFVLAIDNTCSAGKIMRRETGMSMLQTVVMTVPPWVRWSQSILAEGQASQLATWNTHSVSTSCVQILELWFWGIGSTCMSSSLHEPYTEFVPFYYRENVTDYWTKLTNDICLVLLCSKIRILC